MKIISGGYKDPAYAFLDEPAPVKQKERVQTEPDTSLVRGVKQGLSAVLGSPGNILSTLGNLLGQYHEYVTGYKETEPINANPFPTTKSLRERGNIPDPTGTFWKAADEVAQNLPLNLLLGAESIPWRLGRSFGGALGGNLAESAGFGPVGQFAASILGSGAPGFLKRPLARIRQKPTDPKFLEKMKKIQDQSYANFERLGNKIFDYDRTGLHKILSEAQTYVTEELSSKSAREARKLFKKYIPKVLNPNYSLTKVNNALKSEIKDLAYPSSGKSNTAINYMKTVYGEMNSWFYNQFDKYPEAIQSLHYGNKLYQALNPQLMAKELIHKDAELLKAVSKGSFKKFFDTPKEAIKALKNSTFSRFWGSPDAQRIWGEYINEVNNNNLRGATRSLHRLVKSEGTFEEVDTTISTPATFKLISGTYNG